VEFAWKFGSSFIDRISWPGMLAAQEGDPISTKKEGSNMATLDWSHCPAVERVPGRLSGAWVFRDTRMPVSIVFENIEAGATIDEVMERFDVTRE
jgi:uncharacterized protein (DUF433 family)